MENQIRILSTKKLLDNQKQYLLNSFFSVIEIDFIAVKNKNLDLSKINESIIFTSQNAVESILKSDKIDQLKTKNVFCVGIKTKNLLTENGFNVVAHTGYAEDLAEIITLVYSNESYTFFCGNKRRDILPEKLKESNIVFNEIEVYETSLTPEKVDAPLDGILFFSPSAVESYCSKNKLKDEVCFCIGNTTATALENKTKKIIIANQPTIENTIIQTINYYKK
jgi:uroporphyrinogen-III synthase